MIFWGLKTFKTLIAPAGDRSFRLRVYMCSFFGFGVVEFVP